MLMAGKQVTSPGDTLQVLTPQRMYQGITQPRGGLQDTIAQLRTLKTMDANAYRKAKTQLPYVVCGSFSPPIRKKENFAWIQHFMLDIDKLSAIDLSVTGLKTLLQKDERIVLMFTSPGNDGIKVLFHLSAKIHDAGYYSHFYKAFAHQFATQYQLHGAMDVVTHDVSRCCFMSYDPDAFYNENAETVDASMYLNPDELFFEEKKNTNTNETTPDGEQPAASTENKTEKNPPAPKADIPNDILAQIKYKLNPAMAQRSPKQKNYIQPEQLVESLPALKESLAAVNMQLAETKPIQYGRQLKVTAGPYWAEINLFLGKSGYKAVQTTKTGSHAELARLAQDAIELHYQTSPPLSNFTHAEA